MGILQYHYNKVSRFTPERVESDLFKILKHNDKKLIQYNTDQIFSGHTVDGAELPPYSETSINVFGKPSGPWRLYEDGDFFRGWVTSDSWPLSFRSTDEKSQEISFMLKAHGIEYERIFGINTEDRKELSRIYLLPQSQAYFRRILSVR